MMRKLLMTGAAVALLFGATASAQPYGPPDNGYQNQNNGYQNQDNNRDGYYDRDGRWHSNRDNDRYRDNENEDDAGPPPERRDYRQGYYEDNCRRGNNAAGTIFGAIAGGLIGSAASHGNGGAVVGGAILGGLLGNTVTRDMPCEDHQTAFRTYSDGLNGDLNRRYSWRRGPDYGYFTPVREFRRDGYVCRSWTETTYAHGRNFTRSGTACRERDGNWRFN
jgi:surface antigen